MKKVAFLILFILGFPRKNRHQIKRFLSGTLTTKAIKSFQESIGLKPTGELDQETWLALELVTKAGIRKSEIEGLGQILRKDNKQLSEGKVQELKYKQGNELDLNLKIEQFVAVAEKEFQKGFKENNGDNMTPCTHRLKLVKQDDLHLYSLLGNLEIFQIAFQFV